MPEQPKIVPLTQPGVADYHCHPNYSVDAEGTIEEYCEAALKRNLAEICFTTHFDIVPEQHSGVECIVVEGKKLPTSVENLEPYVDHVLRANEEYFPLGVAVKLGVEFGWYPGCEETVLRLQERYDFDYFLCGIHELDGVPICAREHVEPCFSRFGPDEAVAKYFREVLAAVKTGLFDSVAHMEYYRRYGSDYYGKDLSLAFKPYAEELFRALVETDTCVEINTSGIRHGNGHYYPGMAFVNDARRAGVDVKFLGSDSHHPSQVGLDFEAAAMLIPNLIRGCDD